MYCTVLVQYEYSSSSRTVVSIVPVTGNLGIFREKFSQL